MLLADRVVLWNNDVNTQESLHLLLDALTGCGEVEPLFFRAAPTQHQLHNLVEFLLVMGKCCPKLTIGTNLSASHDRFMNQAVILPKLFGTHRVRHDAPPVVNSHLFCRCQSKYKPLFL